MVQRITPLQEMQDRWDRGDRELDNELLWDIQWQEMPVGPHDPLRSVRKAIRDIAVNGRLVLGWVVHANDALFAPGENFAPGHAIFQKLTLRSSQPAALAKAAERMRQIADWAPTDPDVAPLIRFLSDELSRPRLVPVPSKAVGAEGFVFTTFVVIRRHLPGTYLRKPWLPLIIAPKISPFAIIVPGELWNAELLRNWISDD